MLRLLSLMLRLIDCRWGGTALHLVAIDNQIEIARLLLQRSVDVGAKDIQCVVSLACAGWHDAVCAHVSCLYLCHCRFFAAAPMHMALFLTLGTANCLLSTWRWGKGTLRWQSCCGITRCGANTARMVSLGINAKACSLLTRAQPLAPQKEDL